MGFSWWTILVSGSNHQPNHPYLYIYMVCVHTFLSFSRCSSIFNVYFNPTNKWNYMHWHLLELWTRSYPWIWKDIHSLPSIGIPGRICSHYVEPNKLIQYPHPRDIVLWCVLHLIHSLVHSILVVSSLFERPGGMKTKPALTFLKRIWVEGNWKPVEVREICPLPLVEPACASSASSSFLAALRVG